jgi:hypothetical protein
VSVHYCFLEYSSAREDGIIWKREAYERTGLRLDTEVHVITTCEDRQIQGLDSHAL